MQPISKRRSMNSSTIKQDPNLSVSSLHNGDPRGMVTATLLPAQARFGRLFDLPPRGDVSPKPEELGLIGGPMDGKVARNESTKLPAVLTFFGQFVDHDITLDLTSDLEKEADLDAVL